MIIVLAVFVVSSALVFQWFLRRVRKEQMKKNAVRGSSSKSPGKISALGYVTLAVTAVMISVLPAYISLGAVDIVVSFLPHNKVQTVIVEELVPMGRGFLLNVESGVLNPNLLEGLLNGQKRVYIYAVQNYSGEIETRTVGVEETKIVQFAEGSDKPHVSRQNTFSYCVAPRWVRYLTTCDGGNPRISEPATLSFHIPEGSIVQTIDFIGN